MKRQCPFKAGDLVGFKTRARGRVPLGIKDEAHRVKEITPNGLVALYSGGAVHPDYLEKIESDEETACIENPHDKEEVETEETP